jgi:hypothetical protein
MIAARVSFCVALVTVGKPIAVLRVAHGRARGNGVRHANVINAAPPGGSIIVTVSALTAVGWPANGTQPHHRLKLCLPPAATPTAAENVTDHTSQTAALSGIVRRSAWRWPASAQSRLAALGVLICR